MKTVSLDDEAYRLLCGAKVSPHDPFSAVIKRHFDPRARADDLEVSFGASAMGDDDAAGLRSSVRQGFRRPDWET